MPSRWSGDATAVAKTTVSPVVTSAAPEACFAMRPVSKTSRLPPASSTVTSCLDIVSSFHFFAWETFRMGCSGIAEFESTRKRRLEQVLRGGVFGGRCGREGLFEADDSTNVPAWFGICQVHHCPEC